MFASYMWQSISIPRYLVLVLGLILGASQQGIAQLNFLVGYDLGYYPNFSANDIFAEHNDKNDWYKTQMEDVGIQHGLQLGLRYALSYMSLTATYKNIGFGTEAEGIPPGASDSYKREVNFRNNTFGLGLESNFRVFNYGVSLDYQRLRINGATTDLSNGFDIQEANVWNGRVYLQIEFTGDRYIGFAIQPYYSFPLQSFSLDPLSNELEVSTGVEWKNSLFGCSFLMTNGPR